MCNYKSYLYFSFFCKYDDENFFFFVMKSVKYPKTWFSRTCRAQLCRRLKGSFP
jgi:hypothetical protein